MNVNDHLTIYYVLNSDCFEVVLLGFGLWPDYGFVRIDKDIHFVRGSKSRVLPLIKRLHRIGYHTKTSHTLVKKLNYFYMLKENQTSPRDI